VVDFTLTDEQKALREMAHDFAAHEMRPVAAQHDRDGTWPQAVLEKAWELGLMNSHVPEVYGGPGLSYLDGTLVEEELGWGCSGIGTSIAANGLAVTPLGLAGSEALKRRYLYLWLDYPSTEHELEIVRLHAPELSGTVARKLVDVVHQVRELDLKKPPSIAESIDWARALLLLGADDIDGDVFRDTMSIIVKHRTDLDTVAERVGVRLGATA